MKRLIAGLLGLLASVPLLAQSVGGASVGQIGLPYKPVAPVTNGQVPVYSTAVKAYVNGTGGGGGSGTVGAGNAGALGFYSLTGTSIVGTTNLVWDDLVGTLALTGSGPDITIGGASVLTNASGASSVPGGGANAAYLCKTSSADGATAWCVPLTLVNSLTTAVNTSSYGANNVGVDVTGYNGVAMTSLTTGLVKNTVTTGVPSIAIACTDYPGLACTSIFTAAQTVNLSPGANTAADGWLLENLNAATTGQEQESPRVRLFGSGFNTSTTTSQTVEWTIGAEPTNANPPTGNLAIRVQNNGTGGFGSRLLIGQSASQLFTAFTANNLSVTSATIPSNGVYLPAANQTGFATNTTAAGLIDAGQHWRLGNGTAPTISSGACGTGTNGVLTSGNDHGGLITIGSATTSTCAVTFSTAYTTVPRTIHLQAANAAAATALTGEFISALATTGFTITGTLASTTWYYWVE